MQSSTVRLERLLESADPAKQLALTAIPIVQMALTLSHLSDSLSRWAAVNDASVDARIREYNEALDGEDLRLSAVEVARTIFLQSPANRGETRVSLPSAFLEGVIQILTPDLVRHEPLRGQ